MSVTYILKWNTIELSGSPFFILKKFKFWSVSVIRHQKYLFIWISIVDAEKWIKRSFQINLHSDVKFFACVTRKHPKMFSVFSHAPAGTFICTFLHHNHLISPSWKGVWHIKVPSVPFSFFGDLYNATETIPTSLWKALFPLDKNCRPAWVTKLSRRVEETRLTPLFLPSFYLLNINSNVRRNFRRTALLILYCL